MKIPVNFGGGGSGSDDCTATSAQVLSPYTAITNDSEDEPAFGTMADYAGMTQEASGSLDTSNNRLQLTPPNDGRYTTASKLYMTYANARTLIGYTDASKVLSGTTFLGLAGTMANYAGTSTAATSSTSGSNVRLKIPNTGYYDTNAYLTNSYSNMASTIGLTAAKIKYGETILGITGTWNGYVATATDLYYGGAVGTLCGTMSTYSQNGGAVTLNGACAVLDTTGQTAAQVYACLGFSSTLPCSAYNTITVTYNVTASCSAATLRIGVYSTRPTSASAFDVSNATLYSSSNISSTGTGLTTTLSLSGTSQNLYVGVFLYGSSNQSTYRGTIEVTRIQVS